MDITARPDVSKHRERAQDATVYREPRPTVQLAGSTPFVGLFN
ncbi:hypothetical protein SAMN02745121_08694 [Nannocystis exedens]|uniref:Uncharacterized protein n=1 Tax=Nannocystis exedens TaxID=54 RepID=A0A1I2IJK8_9BACT|nr:hypothetical protein NAEX_00190 [Nannocystis exedens]SFF41227.1 hypothetical protein SAMN02745121_08694 [Nannocystis exedens]